MQQFFSGGGESLEQTGKLGSLYGTGAFDEKWRTV